MNTQNNRSSDPQARNRYTAQRPAAGQRAPGTYRSTSGNISRMQSGGRQTGPVRRELPSRDAYRGQRRPNGTGRNNTGRSMGSRILFTVLKVLAVLFTVIIFIGVTLVISIGMMCSDRYPAAQQITVTTFLETGQMKFIPGMFLSEEKIQDIVNSNSMQSLNDSVDEGLIDVGGKSGKVDISEYTDDAEKDIEIVEISGGTYFGTLIIVKDPSRVSVASIYPWREEGVTLGELVESNGSLGGINGGLYRSYNNSGGEPYGVLISEGEIQSNEPQQFPGLVLIGFTEDNILQIIDISQMNSDDILKLVEEKKIRDAVSFQEEATDSNNHFVQLIINNEERQMNGTGSGLNPRTVIGQRADGAVLLLVTDGRGRSGHLGASASDIINIMKEYGAVNAANLDGGSSSCMYYQGEYLMPSVTFYYANSSWKLPAGFVID